MCVPLYHPLRNNCQKELKGNTPELLKDSRIYWCSEYIHSILKQTCRTKCQYRDTNTYIFFVLICDFVNFKFFFPFSVIQGICHNIILSSRQALKQLTKKNERGLRFVVLYFGGLQDSKSVQSCVWDISPHLEDFDPFQADYELQDLGLGWMLWQRANENTAQGSQALCF